MVAEMVYACALVFWSILKTRNSVAREKDGEEHAALDGKLPNDKIKLALPDATAPALMPFGNVTPVLRVHDVVASRDYYVQALGFKQL